MLTSCLSVAQLAELAQFDTPTICNAIELFAVRPRNTGYLNGAVSASYPQLPPMVGYASTATFRSQQPQRSGDAYSSLEAQVERFAELPGPPVVVFQDLDEPVAAATFGEVMCTTYQAFGAAGLITSGAGRDLDQVAALNFPTFTGGTISAHGYCHLPHLHTPVCVGGITIYPGDLLHGDRNGVTTIPLDIASEVAEACREIMRVEEIVLRYLRAGNVTPRGFAAARKACAEELLTFTQRLRRSDLTSERQSAG